MKRFANLTAFVAILMLTGCAGTASQDLARSGVAGTSGLSSVTGQASNLGDLGTAAALAGNATGISTPLAGQNSGLVGLLVQQLGVTPQQATGGAGSIFSVAQQAMSPSSFGQISNAVPGMPQLLAAAPAMTGSSSSMGGGLMGSAANALGGGSSLGRMAMLASSFQGLGLNSGMVNQFIPVILRYLQTQGGSSTMGLLQSALMP